MQTGRNRIDPKNVVQPFRICSIIHIFIYFYNILYYILTYSTTCCINGTKSRTRQISGEDREKKKIDESTNFLN